MTSICGIRAGACVALVAAALLLPSCQVASPATRIGENPVLFESLPAQDKLLVQQGQIRTGMSPEAVFLAWGSPNTKPYVGEKDGKRLVRWVYTRDEAVMVSTGGGMHWGGCGWGYDCSLRPDVAFIPRNAASVTFEDDKVVSWEARW